jgi:hypothetical protein
MAAAPINNALTEHTRKFASLPISANCRFEAGNIMLPFGISLLHIGSEGLGEGRPGTARDAQQRAKRKGDDTT